MIRPERLKPGDKVAAVSLSWGGPGTYPHRYLAGKAQLEAGFGVQVVEMPNTMRDPTWIAQNPRARAEDLMQAFADPEIRGIISTIGGDDSIRILPYLDLDVMRSNPKIFMGYSDTTITHLACWRAGLGSFYGPAFMSGFAENGGMFPYMEDSVRRALFSAEPIGMVAPNSEGWVVKQLPWADPENQHIRRKLISSTPWRFLQGRGKAAGHLLGGCGEVLEFLKGTEWWPAPGDWENAILFIETSEEAPPPTSLVRWLRNYAAQGILHRLSAILLARPGGHVNPEDFVKYDKAVLTVVRDEAGLSELPVVTNLDFGHTDPMFVIPYGARAEIDCDQGTLSITESTVV